MRKKRAMSAVALLTAMSMMSATVFAAGPAGDSENFTAETKEEDGWQEDSNGWWYLDEYGEYPRDCIRYIHGKKYLFDKNGYLTTGWYYNDTEDFKTGWYYFKDNGEMAVDERLKINGNIYGFQSYGLMAENTVYKGNYYNGSGVLDETQGWKKGKNNSWNYVDEDGRADHYGWKEIDGKEYYFRDWSYNIETNTIIDEYFITESGAADKTPGWKQMYRVLYDDDGNEVKDFWWVYAGENGKLVTGWQKIGGEQYYFSEYDHEMCVGSADGYYLNSNGCLDTSYGWKKIDFTWYFVGNDGKLVQGWKEINGVYYYFNPFMETNSTVGDGYYVDSSGAWDTTPGWKPYRMDFAGDNTTVEYGWIYVGNDGHVPEDGWNIIDGVYYYFESGCIYKNCVIEGCYLDGSGAWDTTPGWKHYTTTYLNEWRYVDNNGVPVVEDWKKIDGYYYYFGMNGEMRTSGVYEGCFVNSYGQWDTTPGWKRSGDHWHYVNDTGYVEENCWTVIDGYYYHFDNIGWLDTDTTVDDYYVDENGVRRL